MSLYRKLSRKPKLFLSVTGMNLHQFQTLLPQSRGRNRQHPGQRAPHFFQNTSERPVRLLCMCSPAGQEEFFMKVGVPVASRTTTPPKLDEAGQASFKAKAEALNPLISDGVATTRLERSSPPA